MGFIRTLSIAVLGVLVAAPAFADQDRVCRNRGHCLILLQRYDPQSFDYDVLAKEFEKLSPKARSSVLKKLDDKDPNIVRNAQ